MVQLGADPTVKGPYDKQVLVINVSYMFGAGLLLCSQASVGKSPGRVENIPYHEHIRIGEVDRGS